jgi:signal transduction histidine kinase
VSGEALLHLGDRYAALGLRAAAQAAYRRAAALDPRAVAAPQRLAELALAEGDGRAARRHAEEAHRRAPGPATRLVLARALVAAGELQAARFAFAAVLEAHGVEARLRAAAFLGRAEVAAREGDLQGAGAHVCAALEELCVARAAHTAAPVAPEDLRLVEEVATRAVALDRAADVRGRLAELAATATRPAALVEVALAAVMAAQQAQGVPGVTDADIEAALERALASEPGSRPIELRLALRLSRRRYRDAEARPRAVALLEELLGQLASPAEDTERARVWFLLAGLYEDDPAARARAEAAYRAGLKLRPRHAAAANNLAVLALRQGDLAAARRELARALRLDGDYDVAWLNVARVLDAARASGAFVDDVAGWLEAAAPGAGACAAPAARLARATADAATQSVLEALYAKGHRLKNLLGIAGARVRSARKAAGDSGDPDLSGKLDELERDVGSLYDEWAAHLRTLQAEGPRLEIVPVNPLVAEVVAAAAQDGRAPLRFVAGGVLPDLRGDRALLREALLNLVVNALDAQEQHGERERPVEVATRALVGAGGAPTVEVEIKDHGGGIPRSDLARIFTPGFTTKPHGSGLGLAVAHRVVAAHHGRILVDSEVGRGTTVTVVLPSDLGGFSSLAPTAVSRAET